MVTAVVCATPRNACRAAMTERICSGAVAMASSIAFSRREMRSPASRFEMPRDAHWPQVAITLQRRIEGIHQATKLSQPLPHGISVREADPSGNSPMKLPLSSSSCRTFGEIARTGRSALNFVGGIHSISREQLSTMLALATRPFSADFVRTRFIQLYVYFHRVDGLQAGVYR